MTPPSCRRPLTQVPIRKWVVTILGGVLLLAGVGCAKKNPHQLVVGMELSYPPFEMTDEHNQPAGIGVDLARALAEHLHKELVVQNTSFVGLIPALQTGKIDLIVSSMTITDDRRQSIDFSEPYMHTGICALLSAKSDVQTVADLNQPTRTVVVKDGTTGFSYAREFLPQAHLLQISEPSACKLEVIQGKADAFIYDQMSIYQYHQQNPTTTRAILKPFRAEAWGIGVRKGNDALREQVNAFLSDFRARHGLEELGAKYIRDKDAFREMGFPFSS